MTEQMKYYFECPSCKNDEVFHIPKEDSGDLGLNLFFLGGFISALLSADYSSHKIQCSKCGFIFRRPPLPRTSFSKFSMSIVLLMLIFISAFIALAVYPQINNALPEVGIIDSVAAFISMNSRAVAVLITGLIFLILVICLISSYISNLIAHKKLSKKYKITP